MASNSRRDIVRGAKGKNAATEDAHWQQRTSLISPDMAKEYKSYPMVTAKELRDRRERPRQVKMFMRDFIEGMSSTHSYLSCKGGFACGRGYWAN